MKTIESESDKYECWMEIEMVNVFVNLRLFFVPTKGIKGKKQRKVYFLIH